MGFLSAGCRGRAGAWHHTHPRLIDHPRRIRLINQRYGRRCRGMRRPGRFLGGPLLTDYGHELRFGTFLTPSNQNPERVVGLTQLTEQSGLDLATFQDHPYQSAFFDTWTLLSYLAAPAERSTLAAKVLTLPLPQPPALARSAASPPRPSGSRS